jgi:hypothetical protein
MSLRRRMSVVAREYLSETKREILDSIRDLARRIEHA